MQPLRAPKTENKVLLCFRRPPWWSRGGVFRLRPRFQARWGHVRLDPGPLL